MKTVIFGVLVGTATITSAQTPPPAISQILVSANGVVKTPPDRATIGFTVRGEGVTSDEATAQVRDRAKAIQAGVMGMVKGAADWRASRFGIVPIRSKECDANNYGQERLSTGPCAILGYVATMPVTVDTSRVGDAGTLVGLVGRLGGLNASVNGFWLSDDAPARQQAMRAALANAQAQARLIAESSGGRLGPLLRVQDSDYREVDIAETLAPPTAGTAPPPPPPPPPAPVAIDIKPQPIETSVRLMVAYGIER
ncbi:SIMPL domain-containing protein [Sphingomonas sp.]|uniref:SIMPL domain-containing protein n=1 Tax=Sphingomonas sp. TaxID=28214 RepID=UPI0031D60573